MLSGDVSLLSEACGHIVHNGYDNAHWFLGYRDALGQLQLWGKTDQIQRVRWLQHIHVHVFFSSFFYQIKMKYMFQKGKALQ